MPSSIIYVLTTAHQALSPVLVVAHWASSNFCNDKCAMVQQLHFSKKKEALKDTLTFWIAKILKVN